MKVCVFGTRGYPDVEGGVETYCQMLYPRLEEEMEIILFRRKPYVTANDGSGKVRFIDLPSTKIKGLEALLHSFLSAVYSIALRPDVVHIHNIGPGLFAPLIRLFSVPVVLTYHSPNYEHKKWGLFARKLLRFCEFISLKAANRIIFVNRFQMERVCANGGEKAVYIPNGICRSPLETDCDFLDQHGLEPGRYILSVGRITPEKGFHTLIRGFAQLNCGYKLVIAGSAPPESGYMAQLRGLAESLPVVFPGYVSGKNLAQLYSHAALYVLASENEGFPMVLLEAMNYRRNLLVSDIPATHLVPLEDSDYFPVGDAEALGAGLRRKLQEPAQRAYDLTAFSWEKNAQRVAGIFREVCK